METLINKIRALLQDVEQKGFESFSAAGRTFTISQENAKEISSIIVNGTIIGESGADYTYDADNQIVTIDSDSVSTGDAVIINFIYTKRSDTELLNYIQTSLFYLSDYGYTPINAIAGEIFETESGNTIVPTPTAREENLISTIVGILVNPSWTQYRTSSIQVIYDHSNKLSREQKIEKLINRVRRCPEGIAGVINLDYLVTEGNN